MRSHPSRILSLLLAVITLISLFALPTVSAAHDHQHVDLEATYGKLYKTAVTGTADYKVAFQVLELVNKERKKVGKAALVMDKAMLEAAMQRAAECSLYYSHTRPNGLAPYSLIDRYTSAGENIAAGFGAAADVMDGWMNSPGHRANILDEHNYEYKTIGIGVFKVDGTYYWCQLFNGNTKQATPTQKKAVTETRTIEIRKNMLDLSINSNKLDLQDGEAAQLTVVNYNTTFYGEPTTLAASGLTFTSKDTHVATVNSKGKVTAVAGGSTTITVKSKNGITLFMVPVTVHSTKITAYATATTSGTKVTWSKVDGAAYYRVYKAVYTNGKWGEATLYKTTKTLSCTDSVHKSGQKVKYTIYAYKDGKKVGTHATITSTHLCKPTITAVSTAKGEKISWSKVTGATYYTVSRRVYSNGKWSAYTTIKTTKSRSFTDTKSKAGQKAQYAVVAHSGSNESLKATCTATYLKQPTVKLKKATKGVKITWNKISGAGTYQVYKSVYKNGKWSSYSHYKTTKSTSYTDTTVKKGQKVRYTVYAVCGNCKKCKSAYKTGVSIKR